MRSSLSEARKTPLPAAPKPQRVAFLREHDFAHRGLHQAGVPENSLAAASAAIREGFGVECDVRLSRDGTPVVIHDADCERLCGVPGRIDGMDVRDIAPLRLLGSDQGIPVLADMLALIAGRVPLLIEIKTDGPAAAAICLAVRRELEGYRGEVAVMGFNPEVSHWFGAHAPRIVRGLVMLERRGLRNKLKRRLAVIRAKPDFLAYDVQALPSRLPAILRRRGKPVLTWTVSTAEEHETAAAYADRPIFELPA